MSFQKRGTISYAQKKLHGQSMISPAVPCRRWVLEFKKGPSPGRPLCQGLGVLAIRAGPCGATSETCDAPNLLWPTGPQRHRVHTPKARMASHVIHVVTQIHRRHRHKCAREVTHRSELLGGRRVKGGDDSLPMAHPPVLTLCLHGRAICGAVLNISASNRSGEHRAKAQRLQAHRQCLLLPRFGLSNSTRH